MEIDEHDVGITPSKGAIWKEIVLEINFNDCVTCNDGLPICAVKVNKTIKLSEPINSDSDIEIHEEILIKTDTFSRALHHLETENLLQAAEHK